MCQKTVGFQYFPEYLLLILNKKNAVMCVRQYHFIIKVEKTVLVGHILRLKRTKKSPWPTCGILSGLISTLQLCTNPLAFQKKILDFETSL